jgi:hypothetical protein
MMPNKDDGAEKICPAYEVSDFSKSGLTRRHFSKKLATQLLT